MKKLFGIMAAGACLSLVGASQASAQGTVCIDFTNFCDCLTVTPDSDAVDGIDVRRLLGTWQNQDCAGTTSNLQGLRRSEANSFAGELNAALGLPGLNFNFTWGGGVFDLDGWDGVTNTKFQDESPFSVVGGACPADCSAANKPNNLPPSHQKNE